MSQAFSCESDSIQNQAKWHYASGAACCVYTSWSSPPLDSRLCHNGRCLPLRANSLAAVRGDGSAKFPNPYWCYGIFGKCSLMLQWLKVKYLFLNFPCRKETPNKPFLKFVPEKSQLHLHIASSSLHACRYISDINQKVFAVLSWNLVEERAVCNSLYFGRVSLFFRPCTATAHRSLSGKLWLLTLAGSGGRPTWRHCPVPSPVLVGFGP